MFGREYFEGREIEPCGGPIGPMADYSLGFQSISKECSEVDLPVEGEVPGWLSGTLIRNGPGRFEAGGESVDHWFDGLAMLRKFAFQQGSVTYTNRFLRTDAYRRAERGESPAGFATGSTSFLSRLKAFLLGGPYDNASVIAERIGDRYLALTETPAWVAFDPKTLETEGRAGYDGPEPSGHLACAHLGRDPSGTVVNFEIEFGRTSHYHVYETDGPAIREPIASVSVREPAYMHSFALTERYVVLTEFPFVIDPIDLFKPSNSGGFIDNFRWEPDRGTRFIVIDREAGAVVAAPTTEAFFGFHHVNAFDRDGDIVFDLETVPKAPESLAALYLDGLRSGDLDVPAGSIERFRIVDPERDATIEREKRYDGGTALPTVSSVVRCREHRYAYAQGLNPHATDWPRRVVKIDVADGSAREYDAGGYPSEPVFVPRPGGEAEDDGAVLAVVLDTDTRRSRLVVLDGETLEERARAPLPHALPFDFHGRFFIGG
jgi:carotenoid cleavage dioxygenase-like enzyme